MGNSERDIDRCLTLLRYWIRRRGFTQLDVQQALGWGRSYISQVLTKQKSLRLEQLLRILNVIGVDPADFFAELYDLPHQGRSAASSSTMAGEVSPREFEAMRRELRGLTKLLVGEGVVTPKALSAAVRAADG